MTELTIPRAFIWRRLHSLMGLGLVLFLCEHLFTNARVVLGFGEEGQGFVHAVNTLHNLPYLRVIEITLIGIPLLTHAILGVRYAWAAKFTSGRSDGSLPSIPSFRNRFYTWQRITGWFLLFAIGVHVIEFRFLDYPEEIRGKGPSYYVVKISSDKGLPKLARRLDVLLFDAHLEITGILAQLDVTKLEKDEVFAASYEFGAVTLLSIRDSFKSPFNCLFYTLFVLAACFHAFNGLWTFLLTWGWIWKVSAQRTWTAVTFCLMALFIFFGLSAIWGSYLRGLSG